MKFSISGTASNGLPISRLVELPDEAAVQAYADEHQITLTRVRPLTAKQSLVHQVPMAAPAETAAAREQRRRRALACFFGGWLCLVGGSVCLYAPQAYLGILQFFPLALFLFFLGAIYYPWSGPLPEAEDEERQPTP